MISIAALWWSSSSFGVGLGLGEVNVLSSLSAPLRASIILRGMDGIDLDPEQFSIRIDGNSGSTIDYRLQRVDADTALIHLSTREAISEPVIQFRVEVTWDRSAVARSYDALIDPPAYQQPSSTRAASAGNDSIDPGTRDLVAQPPVIALHEPAAQATTADNRLVIEARAGQAVPADPAIASTVSRREYGPTIDGNSIWRVARAVATDATDVTIYQWMYAIWKANPQAFMDANMHRLNVGEVLTIPLADEVRGWPHIEAWRAYSNQMALLQPATPLPRDAGQQETVADVPQPEVQSTATAVGQAADVAKNEGSVAGAVITDPTASSQGSVSQVSTGQGSTGLADAAGATAAPDALITLLEESAFAMDESAIVSIQPTGSASSALPETTAAADADGIDTTRVTPAAATTDKAAPAVTGESPPVIPGEVILDDIDAAEIGSSADQAAPASAQIPAADSFGGPVQAMTEAPTADWYESLQSRHKYVESMPVIGGAGSLAFVGRALQRADAFVATSPSWAALAFGAWVTLVLVMLRNELVARRQRAPAAVVGKPAVAGRPAGENLSSRESPPVAPRAAVASAGRDAPRQPAVQPPAQSNAKVIVAQADSILARGDTEEAIKLMKLAVELQPYQPILTLKLLGLYHKVRRVDAFRYLLNNSLAVLEGLEPAELAQLQVMHSRLLPRIAFPLAQLLADGNEEARNSSPIEAGPTDQSLPASPDGSPDGSVDWPGSSALNAVDMPLFSAPDPSTGNIAVDDEADQRVMADSVSEDFSHRFDALEGNLDASLEDEDFVETQVIFTNNGVPLREEAIEQQNLAGLPLDLDVTLKEADVYLAYGLYDNAEELLLKGMEIDPNRTDFLARLLDAYYATRNVVDFASCAEVMLDMGDSGREYWDKVEIMGYELAPYNEMFAGGRNRSLGADELGIPKPETADFEFSDIDDAGGEATADFEIYQEVAADGMVTDLNLDLSTSELDDSADPLDEILRLDTSVTPVSTTTSRHDEEEDISVFFIDDGDEVDSAAGEDDHIRSLETSEILGIPDTSENSHREDTSTFDPDPVYAGDESPTAGSQFLSLQTAEILAIPETSDSSRSEGASTFEIDDEALAVDLDAVGQELLLDLDDETVDDGQEVEDGDLDFGDAEVMKFTIEDTLDRPVAGIDIGEPGLSVVENTAPGPVQDSSGAKVDGRILYFPDNNNEGREISEFESEVKMTLQVIRDQLQHITERLFRQERETSDLQKIIADLSKNEAAAARRKNKKSS